MFLIVCDKLWWLGCVEVIDWGCSTLRVAVSCNTRRSQRSPLAPRALVPYERWNWPYCGLGCYRGLAEAYILLYDFPFKIIIMYTPNLILQNVETSRLWYKFKRKGFLSFDSFALHHLCCILKTLLLASSVCAFFCNWLY